MLDVDIHRARNRVRDHQRRRREVVESHDGIDAALEIAIAAQDRARHQVAILDRAGDRLVNRPAVADTGRASVTDQVEAQFLERLDQPRALEVLRDDLRAGREAGLHERLDREPARDRFFRENPGREHHRRIRGVGAARDRRDHDRAMRQRKLSRLGMHFDLVRDMPELGIEDRSLARAACAVAAFGNPLRELVAVDARMLLEFLAELATKIAFRCRQGDSILRTSRSRHARHHAAEIEFEGVGKFRLRRVGRIEKSLRLAVRLDQSDLAVAGRPVSRR